MDNKQPQVELTDQEQFRREKLAKYKEMGVEPFGQAYKVTHHVSDIRALCEKKSDRALERMNLEVSVAGRIMAIRRMGKASFVNIQDKTGNIQSFVGINIIGEKAYNLFKLADIGDIIGIKGRVMKTKTGELTIRCAKYTHLTKCLHPLPEKYHGLTDVEERSRKRYLDLMVNDEARKIAFARPKVVRSIQEYLDKEGFVEVETAVLSPILGGAAARPFITHHNTLDKDFYLRIATELNLKRLIVGGMERVYEIGRLFRNEGMDATHNPEFTSIEVYQAYTDLQGMRKLAEKMVRKAAKDVTGSMIVQYQDKVLDFKSPFKWISMNDLIKEKGGIDFASITDFNEAKKLADEKGVHLDKFKNTVGHVMNEFFEEFCQDDLIQPTFVYSYPIEVSPLTKKGKDPRFTERFELFVNGKELANAYSELNDPIDQKERFLAQIKAKELGDEEASEMDNDFVEALEYGMAPTGGIGMGIDRLVMLLTNQTQVREVILFPMMRDK
jgi:lysyl-tRNA synthetase class 2